MLSASHGLLTNTIQALTAVSPVASNPTCRCMKEGHAGVAAAVRRHCSGRRSAGSSLRVSHTLALVITAWAGYTRGNDACA
jgi:hypothetical protein